MKYFGLPITYIDDELAWDRYLTLKMASLRIQENEEYLRFVTAGGEPGKWKWVFNIERYQITVSPRAVDDLITKQVGKRVHKVGGSKKEFFAKRNLPVVKQLEDGSLIDEKGKRIELPSDSIFVPLKLIESL